MRKPGFLVVLLVLVVGCSSMKEIPPPEQQEQTVVLKTMPPPCRYQVVYRDRPTWVDPAFAAFERRGEYLLEEAHKSRRW